MGMTIYFSDKEISALVSAATEWGEMMADGDEECVQSIEERMKNGLGSALKKLYKGKVEERIYRKY